MKHLVKTSGYVPNKDNFYVICNKDKNFPKRKRLIEMSVGLQEGF